MGSSCETCEGTGLLLETKGLCPDCDGRGADSEVDRLRVRIADLEQRESDLVTALAEVTAHADELDNEAMTALAVLRESKSDVGDAGLVVAARVVVGDLRGAESGRDYWADEARKLVELHQTFLRQVEEFRDWDAGDWAAAKGWLEEHAEGVRKALPGIERQEAGP